jgi:hypothetical protein
VPKKKEQDPLESDPDALEAHLETIARKFDRLKGLYEGHFLGAEKQAPSIPRRELNRLIVEMQQVQVRHVALRFRWNTLLQRWVTYTAYWNRTMREIENGTYRRDLARAQRHLAQHGAINEQQALAMGIPQGRVKSFVEKQNTLANQRAERVGRAQTRNAAASANIPGVSGDDLEEFYRSYQKARADAKDERPLRSLADLSEKLKPQIAKVMAESRSSRVKIEVVVEAGKVKVRARPA